MQTFVVPDISETKPNYPSVASDAKVESAHISAAFVVAPKARLPGWLAFVGFAEFGYYLEVFQGGGVAFDFAVGG